jgi:oxygen-independent coproporphyrinogen-3 oxidase
LSDPQGIPLGVYVHWPFCARICPYCDFNVVRDRGRAKLQTALVAAILQDLKAQAAFIGPRRLISVFFGGGTPSLMAPGDVAAILDLARSLWTTDADLEVTLEANPTDAEAARFADLAAAGVNRLSLGVQSFHDDALMRLGRNHDAAAARRAIDLAGAAFPRLSIDLIHGWPGQDLAAWSADLRAALSHATEHISTYELTIEAGTAFERAARRGTLILPDEDRRADLYALTQDVLGGAGFEAYEVSNHARGPAAQARHNRLYWRGQDYLGVGPGAHGRLTRAGARWALETPKAIEAYIRATEAGPGAAARQKLSPRETALERLLMGLRTHEGVALREIKALAIPQARLSDLADFVEIREDRLTATARGRPVLNALIAELAHGTAEIPA